jgi:putative permease
METIRAWIQRHLSDPQVVALTVVLAIGFGVVIFFGNMLAPVLASLVIAYLLEGLVQFLERRGLPRWIAVGVVFTVFVAFVVLVFFALMPVVSRQLAQLVENLPQIFDRGQTAVLRLPEKYPQLFSRDQVVALLEAVRTQALSTGRTVVSSISFQSVVLLITTLVYMILVPVLVFFFLKDKVAIQDWLSRYLPRHRKLAARVWHEVDVQIGNYVRGKFLEILIVWAVTFVTLSLLGLQFAMLLSVVVGLSVIIPYVGATVVTVPIAIVAYFQFGASVDFVWVVVAYGIIQALDGNVLVPLLFSEVVNLHPVAIIVAILLFGGFWGFWGVFFAIPLATLFQAILNAWPRVSDSIDTDEG